MRNIPKMLSSSKSARVVGAANDKEAADSPDKLLSAKILAMRKHDSGLEPPPGWREAAASLESYKPSTSSVPRAADLSNTGLQHDRLDQTASISPAAPRAQVAPGASQQTAGSPDSR